MNGPVLTTILVLLVVVVALEVGIIVHLIREADDRRQRRAGRR